jgi:hypothetical protein
MRNNPSGANLPSSDKNEDEFKGFGYLMVSNGQKLVFVEIAMSEF